MVVNGKSATAFGIVLGLVFAALLATGQAGCAGASSSIRDKPAVSTQRVKSAKLPSFRATRPIAPSTYSVPRHALRLSSSRGVRATESSILPKAASCRRRCL